ncbi:MAG: phosphatidate cytidylyltransferase [Phycisphaerae bacterium]
MAQKSVKTRVLFGGLMILILAGLMALDFFFFYRMLRSPSTATVFLGYGLIVTVLAALLGLAGSLETIYLARQTGAKPLTPLIIVGSVMLTIQPYLSVWQAAPNELILIAAFFFFFVIGQMLRRQTEGAGANLAWSLFALIYMGLFLSYFVALRTQFGPGPVILLIAAVKCSDIGAYFTGMALGKHKLIPWLSPGKTVEGLLGAIIFSSLVTTGLGLSPLFRDHSVLAGLSVFHFILIGIGFAVIGHLGDLTESLLKRDAQVKDSARLLPEFGGVLDLVDSLLPTGFVWYLALKYIL